MGIVWGIANFKEIFLIDQETLHEIATDRVEKFERFESNVIGWLLAWWLSYGIVLFGVFA